MGLAALAVALLALAAASLAGAKPQPACFGAAARDAAKPCDNPDLHFTAAPRPDAAPLQTNLTCDPVKGSKRPFVCSFGLPKRKARGTVALIGDSHAPAWRAAVDVVVRSHRWRALNSTRSGCAFATARWYVAQKDADLCARWLQDTLRWFRRHPEIHTVFLVNSAGYGFVPASGRDGHETGVDGYREALDALPPSVRHIVVVRDNPRGHHTVLPCVGRAIERRERPDRQCALERERSLMPDMATEAAAKLANGRGHAIDLSRFFCDESLCFPVVGGALVFKDANHLTRTFARSLGPYLDQEFRALGLPRR